MALLPPFSLVFDTTALIAGKSIDWQEFSRLGDCYVPEGVLTQIEFMCDRASEPETERVAREFMRFFPTSGWKKTGTKAEHPLLKPAPGHTLSKRARLALEVLECAYGMALRYPDRLIVLIANDQPMLQQVINLQTRNLCGMPVPALLQWVRSQRRPPVVNHHLQLMRATVNQMSVASTASSSKQAAQPISTPRRSLSTARNAPPTVRPGQYTAQRQRAELLSRQIFGFLFNLVALVVVFILVAATWRFFSPASFDQFWRNLPFVGTQK